MTNDELNALKQLAKELCPPPRIPLTDMMREVERIRREKNFEYAEILRRIRA